MPSDDLKAFRIRQSPGGGRKPAAGPDIEAKILDAAEFVFGHFGYRGATTALIAKKAAIAKPTSIIISRTRRISTGRSSSGP